jgi:hypothetical protein
MLEEKGINYLLPNPIDWHLPLGVGQEKREKDRTHKSVSEVPRLSAERRRLQPLLAKERLQ